MNDEWWDNLIKRQLKEQEEQKQLYRVIRYKRLQELGKLDNAFHITEQGEQIPDWLQVWNEHFKKIEP